MKRAWLLSLVLGTLTLTLAGCATNASSLTSFPASFSPAVKQAMVAYKGYKQTPLLVPTVTPKPSKASMPLKVESTTHDPSFDKIQYLVSFLEINPSTHRPMLPKVEYVTGSHEYQSDSDPFVFNTFSKYNDPKMYSVDAPGMLKRKQRISTATLANSVTGSTDIVTTTSSTDQRFPPVTLVTWHEGKWTFQIISNNTSSATKPISVANNVITHFDSSKLPTPWKNAFVVIQYQPTATIVSAQLNTIVSWDEAFGRSQGKYQVITSNLCADPIFTALNMAASMKKYTF